MAGRTCCVTGHREIPKEQIKYVKEALKQEIDTAVANGYTNFISGFAEGVDQFFAEAVLEKKKGNPDLRLIAAIPTRQRLNSLQKKERESILLDACSDIVVIMENYLPSVYEKRNRYMVENSDRVIAVYDGRKKGGTAGTIRLTHKLNKELRTISVIQE